MRFKFPMCFGGWLIFGFCFEAGRLPPDKGRLVSFVVEEVVEEERRECGGVLVCFSAWEVRRGEHTQNVATIS